MIYCICDQAIPSPRVCGGDCKKSKAYRLIQKKRLETVSFSLHKNSARSVHQSHAAKPARQLTAHLDFSPFRVDLIIP
nr:MAG TPA_asm: hypothetical protein [Caudoviricetes sp.]